MSKIFIRQCPKCKLYYDISLLTCKCGENLGAINPKLVETDDLKDEEKGEINENVIAYVQKCPRCRTNNFTFGIDQPVVRCYGCGREIRNITPRQFKDEIADNKDNEKQDEETSSHQKHIKEDESPKWEDLVKNVRKSVGLETQNITLTAISGGELSFTIKAEDEMPYILGREANQKEFLKKDLFVGNKHCLIFFKSGSWYVKDNNSQNGTFVNSEDIGQNGEKILKDGDELKLGHNEDSITFSVNFN